MAKQAKNQMRFPKIRAKGLFSVLLALWFFLGSCSPEPIDFNDNDAKNVGNETASDAYFAESEDLTTVTVSSDNATAGGRVSAGARVILVNDPRLSCATVTLEPDVNSTLLIPKGILSIDFGAGCTDKHGIVRKGKITIAYHGRRFLPNSSVVTTLVAYEINGVKIEGIRTVANTSASTAADPVFTTTMAGGKITWPDGTSVSRDETTTRERKLGATPDNTQWFVTGSATGTNRNGLDYSVTITGKLVYKRECALSDKIYIAVQGTKELVISSNSKKIAIDYGSGVCDRLVTVTIKSKSKVVEL
jgi:hypothetical protein